jgi:malonyl CoA-acyl carrier protein transacylase
METASEKTGGTMAAVIGAERSKLKEAIGRCSRFRLRGDHQLQIRDSQVVLSGEHAALDEAIVYRGREDRQGHEAQRIGALSFIALETGRGGV